MPEPVTFRRPAINGLVLGSTLILSLPIRPFVQGLLNMLKKPEIPYARTRDLSKASN